MNNNYNIIFSLVLVLIILIILLLLATWLYIEVRGLLNKEDIISILMLAY